MKKTGLIIMGLAVVMGIGSAAGVCAGTKKIIRFDEGKRVEIDVENGVAGATDAAAIHASTLASIAEKSATMNFLPSCGTKAVRMSCESVSGISSYSMARASKSPAFTSPLACARSGIWFWGRFCSWIMRPENLPVLLAP